MPNVQACPSTQELQQLVAGRLLPQRARELARHLEECDRCRANAHTLSASETIGEAVRAEAAPDLESPYDTPPPPPGPAAWANAGANARPYDFLRPPQGPDEIGRLGDYRVLRELGQGGMGVVFLAEDTQLKRLVALKTMRPEAAAAAAARERFLREAQAIAALKHDHVVTIHQVGEEGGVPFLAMEFLEGESLEERLKRESKLPLPEVLRIGRQAAEGLVAAHARGLIHRDVKPGNIWLEASPGEPGASATGGRVKLLDFGLVRPGEDVATLTESGTVIGTPAYMAPEQARAEPIDARCDLFSLGCVLYRMVTGALPFPGKDVMSVLVALSSKEPEPPRALNPDVPPPLSALILRLLAKDPADRPASAREVVQALAAVEEAAPGASSEPAAPARASPRWRFGLVGMGVAVLLAVLAGAVYLFAPMVLRIATNKGELVIAADDKDVEVTVKHPDGNTEVHIIDHHQQREWVLRPGDYEIDVKEKDGAQFATRKLTLRRGEREVVKAELVLAEAERPVEPPRPEPPAARPTEPPADLVLLDEPVVEGVLGDGRMRHWRRVTSITFSADGKLLATGSIDATARVWDPATGQERAQLGVKGFGGDVFSVAFHPTRKLLATGTGDKRARVWDLNTGTTELSVYMEGWVNTVAFSPDGRLLAVMAGKTGKVVEADTGKEVFTMPGANLTSKEFAGMEGIAGGAAFRPDGKLLACRADDGVKLLDPATGKQQELLKDPKTVSCLAWSVDGKRLVTGTMHPDPEVKVLDAASGTVLHTFTPDAPDKDLNVLALALSPDGGRLAAALGTGFGCRVRLWDLSTGGKGIQLHMTTLDPLVVGLAFTPDGRSLVTGSGEGLVRLWDPGTGQERAWPWEPGTYFCAHALSPDGKTIACGGYDSAIRLFDAATQKQKGILHGHAAPCWSVAFAPDSRALASAGNDGTVRLWDTERQEEKLRCQHGAASVAFRPDGKMWASANRWIPEPLKLWDTATGAEGPKLDLAGVRLGDSFAFSPDNATLATCCLDQPVILWDLATGKKKRELAGDPDAKAASLLLAFSPDGKTLALASWWDSKGPPPITFWDMATGELRLRTERSGILQAALAFRPDGKVLASGGDADGAVYLWDTATGKRLKRYQVGPPKGWIRDLAFTPDGRRLVVRNGNGTVSLLRLTTP
jgi:WD40 repeat protein/tRNA A-37 threonylcarbamoyl transferase component Bud32